MKLNDNKLKNELRKKIYSELKKNVPPIKSLKNATIYINKKYGIESNLVLNAINNFEKSLKKGFGYGKRRKTN